MAWWMIEMTRDFDGLAGGFEALCNSVRSAMGGRPRIAPETHPYILTTYCARLGMPLVLMDGRLCLKTRTLVLLQRAVALLHPSATGAREDERETRTASGWGQNRRHLRSLRLRR